MSSGRASAAAIHGARVFLALLAAATVVSSCSASGRPRSIPPAEAARRARAVLDEPAGRAARESLAELRIVGAFLEEPRLARRVALAIRDLEVAAADPELRRAVLRARSALAAELDAPVVGVGDGGGDGEAISLRELAEELANERDMSARRRAWRALVPRQNRLVPLHRTLMERRNALARAMGYEDENERAAAGEEVDEGRWIGWLSRLAALPSAARRDEDRARSPLALPSVEPHPLAARIDSLVSREDALAAVADRCVELGFDRAALARFVASEESRGDGLDLAEDGGIRGLFERAGRFLYREHLPDRPPEFARVASPAMERAVARWFAAVVADPAWVEASFPEVDVEAVATPSLEARLLEALYLAARAEFEYEAHRNPGRDLDELWWNLLEKWTGVRREDEASSWTTDPLLDAGSFRARSELVSRVVAGQIRHYLVFATGSGPGRTTPTEAWIEHVFRAGASSDWTALVRDLTHEPPNPDYWFRDLVEGTSLESLERQRRRREATERLRQDPGRR